MAAVGPGPRPGLGPADDLLRLPEGALEASQDHEQPSGVPFSAGRLRTAAAKRYKKVENATAVIWETLLIVRRLDAPELPAEVAEGVVSVDARVKPSETPPR